MRKEMHLKKKSLKRDNNSFLKARHESKLTSLNVIAKETKKSTGNEKAVVVSSHYDSVVGAPGANDNASGTGLVLELARAFSKCRN